MQTEIWRPVVGFENQYEVSCFGRVRTIERSVPTRGNGTRVLPQKIMSTHITKNGYEQLMFKTGSKNVHQLVHRLVAFAFVYRPDHKTQVNHIDGNKLNNHASNLEWATSKENCAHARAEHLYEPARGERAGGAKLSESAVLAIRAKALTGATHGALAAEYMIARSAITRIVNRERWAHI